MFIVNMHAQLGLNKPLNFWV